MIIHPARFDLMAKYLYIKAKDKELNTEFFKELYHKHIKTFNNCKELPDLCLGEKNVSKSNIEDFYKNFDKLIKSLRDNGYDEKYPISHGNNNVIINGAHRLMICYYYNINPIIKKFNEPGNVNYNYNFFLNRKPNDPLEDRYADSIALEYIKHNPNMRCMLIYPVAYNNNKINQIFNIIKTYGYIYYHKQINLTWNGINNLIKEAYREEEWIGGLFPPGFSPGGKAQRCIANSPTIYISICMYDLAKCIELKEKCRTLFDLGKHSLHLSDYQKDTFRISTSILNKNSIEYLNKCTNDISSQTKKFIGKLF